MPRLTPRRRRVLRVLWLVWCGFWALAWLVKAVESVAEYARYGVPGVEFDATIAVVGFVLSLAAMRLPVATAKPQGEVSR